jgi:hypothetical protein
MRRGGEYCVCVYGVVSLDSIRNRRREDKDVSFLLYFPSFFKHLLQEGEANQIKERHLKDEEVRE